MIYLHKYSTRTGNNLRLSRVRTHWGQQMSQYILIKEWNDLLIFVRESSNILNIRKSYFKHSLEYF